MHHIIKSFHSVSISSLWGLLCGQTAFCRTFPLLRAPIFSHSGLSMEVPYKFSLSHLSYNLSLSLNCLNMANLCLEAKASYRALHSQFLQQVCSPMTAHIRGWVLISHAHIALCPVVFRLHPSLCCSVFNYCCLSWFPCTPVREQHTRVVLGSLLWLLLTHELKLPTKVSLCGSYETEWLSCGQVFCL